MGIFSSFSSPYATSMIALNPKTFKQLQSLTMSLADVTNKSGKKSLFGKDLGAQATLNFYIELKKLFDIMLEENIFDRKITPEKLQSICKSTIDGFLDSFTGWDDARFFSDWYFSENNPNKLDLFRAYLGK